MWIFQYQKDFDKVFKIESILVIINRAISFVDLFAGIGGFRLALERQGAQCIFTSENNKFAQMVYQANFTGQIDGDISKISEQDIPAHDVLCAGFPCQAFSTVGQKKGFHDVRGTMFFEILRLVKHHQPKVLLLENVNGLLHHDKGFTFKTIRSSLIKLGYSFYHQVLNATMFGLPQLRKRVFMVVIRKDLDIGFQFPIGSPTNNRLKDIVESHVDAHHFLSEQRYNFILNKKVKNQCRYGYHLIGPDDFVFTLLNSKYEHNLIVDHSTPIGNFVNIKSKGGDSNIINQYHVRRLTPREYARLQGFSDNFLLPVSNKQAYKLLGNAVAVPVVEVLFKAIRQQVSF
jgi:DNA (cytosine-5)-methyltransferase 1